MISFIVPVYNEEKNLPLLFNALHAVIQREKYIYEIILVDDCSRDASLSVLRERAQQDKRIKVIAFDKNRGQTAALLAGIDHATGDVLIPLDSDLENNPEDIPLLISKLNAGFDVVSGWRQKRWEGNFLSRKLPSVTANWLISKITGVALHDWGCTLKAYRREVIQDVPLYGEMHRFIPAYASWRGAKVTEIPVQYKKRLHGKSNYGISRTFRVLLDLLLIKFLEKYQNRPIHFFGGFGFLFLFLGGLTGAVAVGLRLFLDLHLVQTPLPTLAALFLLMGLNFILIGVVAEMIVRSSYESGEKKSYRVRHKINL